MQYHLDDALPVLRRTPAVLDVLLRGLPDGWTMSTEGEGTWSAFDVVGHLIHGEQTDWMPRVQHLLRHGEAVPFLPFERDAMFEASRGRTLNELLDTFAAVRTESIERLLQLQLQASHFRQRGAHPQFGSVSLEQLLSTWVVHDLTHISQIVRVMAHQYADAVGPWRAYLSVVQPRAATTD